MDKRNFLSPHDRDELITCAKSGRVENRYARRANAIILINDGMSIQQVAKVFFLDDTTVRRWLENYCTGGYQSLMTIEHGGRNEMLSEAQKNELRTWVTEELPRSATEVGDWIRRKFQIEFNSRSSLIKLLHRLGFDYRKPGLVLKNLDPVKQQEHIDKYQRIIKNQSDNEVVVFVDAFHPTFESKAVGCWTPRGQKVGIEQTTKRLRLNIHGAINLETGETKMVEAQTINTDSTIDLLQKLEQQYSSKQVIHVILDNAPCHHAKKVSEWLRRKNCKIKLHFLPPYCPHLNPIERLWGVMHKNITHNRSHKNMRKFSQSVLGFLNKTVPSNWAIYCDQISDNFRVISHENYRILK